MALVDELVKEGWLKTESYIKAFSKINRKDFILEENLAEINTALPIGFGQTISQPLVVAFMIEKLGPEKGDNILDIGSGSGWTTALLAEIVGDKGKITSMEIIPELKDFGEKNVSKYGFVKKGTVEYILRDGTKGFPLAAPFDRILVSATALRFYQSWKEQLKVGGKIVFPMLSSIWEVEKRGKDDFLEKEHPGFVFVPLIEK